MARKYIDCREYPSKTHCSLAMSADNENELLNAAVQHAISIHGETDTPELHQQIKQLMHEGEPPSMRPQQRPGTRPSA